MILWVCNSMPYLLKTLPNSFSHSFNPFSKRFQPKKNLFYLEKVQKRFWKAFREAGLQIFGPWTIPRLYNSSLHPLQVPAYLFSCNSEQFLVRFKQTKNSSFQNFFKKVEKNDLERFSGEWAPNVRPVDNPTGQ